MKRLFLLGMAVVLGAGVRPSPVRATEWRPGFLVVPTPGRDASLGNGDHPAVLDARGRIHLFFQSVGEDGTRQIGHMVRDTSGSWGANEIVSWPGQNAHNPTVARDHEGRIHVVWENGSGDNLDIAYRAMERNGTWEDPMLVSPAPRASRHPCVVVDAADDLHVVWMDDRLGYRATYHCSAPVGGQWGEATVLTASEDGPDQVTATADSIGNVIIVWRQKVEGIRRAETYGLFTVRMRAGVGIVPAPVPLVSLAAVSTDPYVEAAPDGTVYLVWLDDRSTARQTSRFEVFYKRYLAGIGWGYDKRFTYDTSDNFRPIVVPGPNRTVNTAWLDYGSGNPEIYYRQITPETGWDPDPTRITTDLSASESPVILSLPDDMLILFWTDALPSGHLRILAKEGAVRSLP